MAIKTSRAGECAWEPANRTASPRRGAGGLPVQVPAALTSEESAKPLGLLAQTVSIVARTLAALLMLGKHLSCLQAVLALHQEGENCCAGTSLL